MGESRTIKKVLATVPYTGEHWDTLAKALEPAEIIRIKHSDTTAMLNAIKDVDVAIIAGNVTKEMLNAAKNIKWIHGDFAGLNDSAHPEIFERNIILSSSAGRSAEVLAEHAFYFMLSFIYDSHQLEINQHAHVWDAKAIAEKRGLITKTLGIIGYGNTGKHLVKLAGAFGMRILVYSRSAKSTPAGVAKFYSQEKGDTIDELLKESDIITLSMSLSDNTKHMIDEHAFSLMKPTAFLVNMARGAVVDEKALYKALVNKTIAGCGSDVFETEPLPSDSPLWDLPNLYITPHNTPAVQDKVGASLRYILENIKHYKAGEPLVNVLDKRDLYSKR
ncbi:MAG: D-2-hydroxyacid dehydrogenase [Treponema sp.]|nr:D-2-hydroxyacid dehydrogenase [Treponema sp.]